MANTTVTTQLVTYDVAMYFANSLRGVGQFSREYSDEFANDGAKVGDTVKIRLPQQFEVSEGEALVIQNILDRTVNLILNRRRHIGFGWSSAEASTDLDDIRGRYVQPAAETLANIYDRVALGDVYKAVYNVLGTPGTTPNASLTYANAATKIQDLAGPDYGIVAILEPYAGAVIADAVKALQVPVAQLSQTWKDAFFANNQLGIDKWWKDQNIPRHTTGTCTAAATPLINGAGQTGSSIVTDGWGASTANLKKGDSVSFAGSNWVNPLSKESVGRLAQFTLTADAASDGSGNITLSISPAIYTSGPLQNVSASPADNATITYWAMAAGGTQTAVVTPQNLVFHPKAFATAMVDLVAPNGGAKFSRASSKMLNVCIRYVEQFDITSDQNLNRLDMLFGNCAVQERLATRVAG